ncbi:hypothetical protein O3P69_016253 [Scylla paramamosain]|uniref:Uncharacterized protein n=1 Tax=Scylla paramamosain TaxID=85552 RepID=A0AAW0S9N3_SCYPA
MAGGGDWRAIGAGAERDRTSYRSDWSCITELQFENRADPATQSSRYLINEQWGRTLRDREIAMIQTSVNSSIRHDQQAHSLTPLRPGQRARIQNPSSGRWDQVGTVLELSAPCQYLLRLDGSGRASIRNRRYLRPLTGEPQLSDDSTESSTPVRVTTPRPRRTQRAPRHLDDYFLNSPVFSCVPELSLSGESSAGCLPHNPPPPHPCAQPPTLPDRSERTQDVPESDPRGLGWIYRIWP